MNKPSLFYIDESIENHDTYCLSAHKCKRSPLTTIRLQGGFSYKIIRYFLFKQEVPSCTNLSFH
jgi:hypothetical protein